MNKIILVILLAVMSSSVMAEWVEIGVTDNGTFYVDPTTIRKSGNKVKMWMLLDLNSVKESAAGIKFLSTKNQDEYDCKEEQYRTLYFSWHSENMGRGIVVYSNNEPNKNLSPFPPEDINESLWEFACGK